MNDRPDMPDLDRAGVLEEDLLAFLEGAPFEPAAQRRLDDAFERDPALRRWAQALADDRALVRDWLADAEAQAPAGLAHDALAIAEREALVGAASRRAPRRRVLAVRGLALAAVVALAATASVFFWRASNQQPAPAIRGAPLAKQEQGAPVAPQRIVRDGSLEQSSPALRDETNRLALRNQSAVGLASAPAGEATNGVSAPASPPIEQTARADAAEARKTSPLRLADGALQRESGSSLVFPASAPGADADARNARPPQIPPDDALRMAQAGRLAVVARTPRPAEFVAAFVDTVKQAEPGLRLRPTVNGAGDRAAVLGDVTLPADAAALEALRFMLVQSGADDAMFIERAQPISLPVDAHAPGPAWWRNPTSRWWPRVVVELRLEPDAPAQP